MYFCKRILRVSYLAAVFHHIALPSNHTKKDPTNRKDPFFIFSCCGKVWASRGKQKLFHRKYFSGKRGAGYGIGQIQLGGKNRSSLRTIYPVPAGRLPSPTTCRRRLWGIACGGRSQAQGMFILCMSRTPPVTA